MGTMIEFPDIQVFRRAAFYTGYFRSGELRFDVTRDGPSYLILKLENRFPRAVEPVAPKAGASIAIDKLSGERSGFHPIWQQPRLRFRALAQHGTSAKNIQKWEM